jgi:hypothetical protein
MRNFVFSLSYRKEFLSFLIVILASLCVSNISKAQTVGAVPAAVKTNYNITSPWYAKYVDANGIPVLGSSVVSDAALVKARSNILRLLATLPTSAKAKLVTQKVRVVIWARTEKASSIPEFFAQYGTTGDATYWGGFGPRTGLPICGGTEANLIDNYGAENVFVHEFAHGVAEMALASIDANFTSQLNAAWTARSSVSPVRWAGTYAATDTKEYWAEGVQSYFNVNRAADAVHNDIDTRAELQTYDPPLYALINRVYGAGAL